MKVFITIPDFSLHGGIRVILEWANRLTEWHEVYLHNLKSEAYCRWFKISPLVKIVGPSMLNMDCLIITSPHSINFQNHQDCPKKVFIFCQMCEHLFHPKDEKWYQLCRQFYTSQYPLISISQWNIDVIKNEFNRKGQIKYIGNGVNLSDFPISEKPKDGKFVLVEGWNSNNNSSKDSDSIGPQVALRLKREGYKIIGYSQKAANVYLHAMNEFYVAPNLSLLNQLYDRATIMIKATKYDARSCAPVEAMTKGTVTARAIIQGDDDLVHDHNCLRSGYSVDELYKNAKLLLTDESLRNRLAGACIHDSQKNTWDSVMYHINYFLTYGY